jgi:hypothetical protein
MTQAELNELAAHAMYVGSSEHKDVPSMGLVPRPREGALRVEEAEGLDNPDCMLCPRKWVGRQDDATDLLRGGIRLGQVSEDGATNSLPSRVWVRDPEDGSIVYEAKRLSHPEGGYKAYPLTTRQSRNLPLRVR